jgi:hypothetical protein
MCMLGFIWPWSVLFEKVPLAQPAFVPDSMECLVVYLVPGYMAYARPVFLAARVSMDEQDY